MSSKEYLSKMIGSKVDISITKSIYLRIKSHIEQKKVAFSLINNTRVVPRKDIDLTQRLHDRIKRAHLKVRNSHSKSYEDDETLVIEAFDVVRNYISKGRVFYRYKPTIAGRWYSRYNSLPSKDVSFRDLISIRGEGSEYAMDICQADPTAIETIFGIVPTSYKEFSCDRSNAKIVYGLLYYGNRDNVNEDYLRELGGETSDDLIRQVRYEESRLSEVKRIAKEVLRVLTYTLSHKIEISEKISIKHKKNKEAYLIVIACYVAGVSFLLLSIDDKEHCVSIYIHSELRIRGNYLYRKKSSLLDIVRPSVIISQMVSGLTQSNIETVILGLYHNLDIVSMLYIYDSVIVRYDSIERLEGVCNSLKTKIGSEIKIEKL